MRHLLLTAACLMPMIVWAVGNEDNDPPKPTRTTLECNDGRVWDDKAQICVDVKSGLIDDDARYRAAREFAWAGQYENAISALAAMSDPQEDRVLTYMGFSLRKSGEVMRGMSYYQAALDANPDNLLARSYLGQAFVTLGAAGPAREQLAEIRARGGAGSWPEIALERSIATGVAADN